MFAFVASALLAIGAAAPSMPNQYYVSGTITLPYGNITEPFSSYVDLVNNMQRVDYYDGLDVYITRGDLNAMYQVNPVSLAGKNSVMCFETDGPINATSFFPDLSVFTPVSGSYNINGVPAIKLEYNFTNSGRLNAYSFFISAKDNTPLQYSWVGYDVLLGSHFDEYIISYNEFIPGTSRFNSSVFAKPSIGCGPFPGPSFGNPSVNSISSLFPKVPSAHFQAYADAHGKAYNGSYETYAREHHFHRNVRYINAMNRFYKHTGSTLVLAVNPLADHSEAELYRRAGVKNTPKPANNGAQYVHPPPLRPEDLPASVNWVTAGAVTPVKDQGICGSCWSFGTAETLEGAYFRKTGTLLELSQQQLMDCSWSYQNYACDGGEDFQAYQYIMSVGGLMRAADYGPYLMADGMCHDTASGMRVNITSYTNVTSQSETALMDALANVGPISVAIDASLLSFSFYSSGVYYDANCASDPASLDHAVLAVGYGTDDSGNDYWVVKNSWSTHWGNNGYVWIARKDNDCGVATAATYVAV